MVPKGDRRKATIGVSPAMPRLGTREDTNPKLSLNSTEMEDDERRDMHDRKAG